MKKSDLETIVKKIQNRCYLENPTKITYYWNEEHQVVFKIFFESLYLPKELRVDEDNIQNNFLTQNVYEYEDDFTILELNQDEGYIKVLPDDQNFKVIHNYREANKDESIEESKKVHLSTKSIKETFAVFKGYLLQEDEPTKEEIPNPETDTINQEVEKEQEAKKIDADVYVIASAFDLNTDSKKNLKNVINKTITLISNKNNTKAKVIFTVPKIISEDLKGTTLNYIARFNQILKSTIKDDTYTYFADKDNVNTINILKELNIKNTYFITSTAEEAIKQANLPDLLKTAQTKDLDVVEDTSVETLKNAREAALKIIDLYRKDVKKSGGVHKDFSKDKLFNGKKNWDKRRKFLESHLNGQINAAITFCTDLYGNNASDADREIAKERNKALDNALKGVKNIGNTNEVLDWYDKVSIEVKTIVNTAITAGQGELTKGLNSSSDKLTIGADTGMIKNGNEFGGATAGLVKGKVNRSKEPPKSKKLKVTDYYGDFPIKIAVNETGTDFNSKFKELLNFFAEDLTAKDLDSSTKGTEQEEKDDQENKAEDKDTKKTDQTNTKDGVEADDVENAIEIDDAESTANVDNSQEEK